MRTILRIRTWIVFALLVCSAALAHEFSEKKMIKVALPEGVLSAVVPEEFSEWTLDKSAPVIIANPEQEETLGRIYSDTLSRTYVNKSGQRVMLSLAYGANQSEGLQVHFPEVCYNAQGFSVGPVKDASVKVLGNPLSVRRLVAKIGARNEPITYWVVVGDKIVNRALDQKFVLLRYGVKRVIPDGVLIRVSSIGNNETDQYKLQEAFLQDLFSAMKPGPKARFLGINSI